MNRKIAGLYKVVCIVSLGIVVSSFCDAEDYVFNPKLGVCSSVGHSPAIKAAGFDYLEASVQRFLIPDKSDDKFAQKYAEFEALGCPVYSYNGFIPGQLKSVGPDVDHEAILKYAEIAFQRAQRCGSKIIVFGSGGSRQIPKGFSSDQAEQQFIALFKRMGPVAEKYGMVVVIEPLNSKECNFINTVRGATELVRAVAHPNVKVLADFYHMAIENEGPESILFAGDALVHCHIAEKQDRCSPGQSMEDFSGYLEALRQINYKGCISVECRWNNIDKELPVAMAYLKFQIARVNAQ